ncbi:MAG: NUDIX hydrolase [Candidatus Woesebacteria bacterium]|jgi:ADP-ribose pyrophosphatase YjhB (NUDIX family)
MKINDTMHTAQVAILRALLFAPDASFAQLQKASKLSSDHFNFHLKRMIEQDVVKKNERGNYLLTTHGKEYANRFDTDERIIEKQPKIAVCLKIMRDDGLLLVQQRLKHPYYGYWCRPTGKVRWGESILQTAARELMEETGLEADFVLEELYHKQDFNKETGGLLEDKMFFMIACNNTRGDLIVEFEGGRNAWMTPEDYASQEFTFGDDSATLTDVFKHRPIDLIEARHEYLPQHY